MDFSNKTIKRRSWELHFTNNTHIEYSCEREMQDYISFLTSRGRQYEILKICEVKEYQL